MQLSEFMKDNGLRDADIVERLKDHGITVHRAHITHLRNRDYWPGMRLAVAIRDLTDGQVTLDEQIPLEAAE